MSCESFDTPSVKPGISKASHSVIACLTILTVPRAGAVCHVQASQSKHGPILGTAAQQGFVGGVNSEPAKCASFNTQFLCPFVVKNLFEIENAGRPMFEEMDWKAPYDSERSKG
jgi:hypothetical protein